jgi:hypothetical protein
MTDTSDDDLALAKRILAAGRILPDADLALARQLLARFVADIERRRAMEAVLRAEIDDLRALLEPFRRGLRARRDE